MYFAHEIQRILSVKSYLSFVYLHKIGFIQHLRVGILVVSDVDCLFK